MKSWSVAILVSVLLASLTGCVKPAGEDSGGAAFAAAPTDQGGKSALPAVTQLAVGTLKLEDGDLAVGAEQAAALLPLWKAYLALSQSDSAVEPELEALVEQIDETMTPEQTRAIAAMQLTAEDMAALTQELGVIAVGADRADGLAGASSGRQGGFVAGGGPPGGVMPPGGFAEASGMMPRGGQAPAAAGDGQRAAARMTAAFPPLIEAVVELLKSKV